MSWENSPPSMLEIKVESISFSFIDVYCTRLKRYVNCWWVWMTIAEKICWEKIKEVQYDQLSLHKWTSGNLFLESGSGREERRSVQEMLKSERQDLSWQPYCQHSIIQSNPHLNRKQWAQRKTGRTKQQQGVREEEIYKNSPLWLNWNDNKKGHTTITQLERHKKGRGNI